MGNSLAIIVLNYKNWQETEKCVDNLIGLETPAEIVIVDNLSGNGSFEKLSEKYGNVKGVHVITSEKNGGYSYGNNFGIRYICEKESGIRYISIMNPDVIIKDRRTFEDNIKILEENPDIAGITSVIIQEGERSIGTSGWMLPTFGQIVRSDCLLIGKLSAFLRTKNTVFEENDRLRYTEVIHGSFFIMKADVFRELSYFDEDVFMYYEENILGFKVKSIGKRLAVNKLDDYYHNHNFKAMDLKAAQKSAAMRRDSQSIYLSKYMKVSQFALSMVRGLYNFYIYVELPVVKFLKEILRGK